MNILLLSYNFLPDFEGSTSLFTIIADLLANNGHNVWVITHKFKGMEYNVHPKIKMVFVSREIPQGEYKTSLLQTIRFTKDAAKKGIEIVKKEGIDIIHSNAVAGLAGSKISAKTSKPHIILIHDLYSTDPNFWKEWQKQEGNSPLKAWLGKKYEKKLVGSNYSAIHTVSEASRDDLIQFGVKKPIFVIHNAIPIKDAKIVQVNPYQLVYVGRLVFFKNLQVAIKAIKLLTERFPKINLIIIGKGPYRPKLEKLVEQYNLQNNVTFKGHVSEEEKNHIIASSQALVFPSRFEGFGLVILEAFMQKKPVLVSNVRPMSDIVENQKTGLVVSAHDEKAWAESFDYIFSNIQAAQHMGEEGRNVLEKKFTIDVMSKEITKMYENVITKKYERGNFLEK